VLQGEDVCDERDPDRVAGFSRFDSGKKSPVQSKVAADPESCSILFALSLPSPDLAV
jgi:hypothetical protein